MFQRFGCRDRFPYEEDPRSTASISSEEGECYYAGGFTGGTAEAYLGMSEALRQRIDEDLAKDLIAVWHDESHLNRYFLDNEPTRLDPGYCYPERWRMPFKRRLLALDKNHAEMRQ